MFNPNRVASGSGRRVPPLEDHRVEQGSKRTHPVDSEEDEIASQSSSWSQQEDLASEMEEALSIVDVHLEGKASTFDAKQRNLLFHAHPRPLSLSSKVLDVESVNYARTTAIDFEFAFSEYPGLQMITERPNPIDIPLEFQPNRAYQSLSTKFIQVGVALRHRVLRLGRFGNADAWLVFVSEQDELDEMGGTAEHSSEEPPFEDDQKKWARPVAAEYAAAFMQFVAHSLSSVDFDEHNVGNLSIVFHPDELPGTEPWDWRREVGPFIRAGVSASVTLRAAHLQHLQTLLVRSERDPRPSYQRWARELAEYPNRIDRTAARRTFFLTHQPHLLIVEIGQDAEISENVSTRGPQIAAYMEGDGPMVLDLMADYTNSLNARIAIEHCQHYGLALATNVSAYRDYEELERSEFGLVPHFPDVTLNLYESAKKERATRPYPFDPYPLAFLPDHGNLQSKPAPKAIQRLVEAIEQQLGEEHMRLISVEGYQLYTLVKSNIRPTAHTQPLAKGEHSKAALALIPIVDRQRKSSAKKSRAFITGSLRAPGQTFTEQIREARKGVRSEIVLSINLCALKEVSRTAENLADGILLPIIAQTSHSPRVLLDLAEDLRLQHPYNEVFQAVQDPLYCSPDHNLWARLLASVSHVDPNYWPYAILYAARPIYKLAEAVLRTASERVFDEDGNLVGAITFAEMQLVALCDRLLAAAVTGRYRGLPPARLRAMGIPKIPGAYPNLRGSPFRVDLDVLGSHRSVKKSKADNVVSMVKLDTNAWPDQQASARPTHLSVRPYSLIDAAVRHNFPGNRGKKDSPLAAAILGYQVLQFWALTSHQTSASPSELVTAVLHTFVDAYFSECLAVIADTAKAIAAQAPAPIRKRLLDAKAVLLSTQATVALADQLEQVLYIYSATAIKADLAQPEPGMLSDDDSSDGIDDGPLTERRERRMHEKMRNAAAAVMEDAGRMQPFEVAEHLMRSATTTTSSSGATRIGRGSFVKSSVAAEMLQTLAQQCGTGYLDTIDKADLVTELARLLNPEADSDNGFRAIVLPVAQRADAYVKVLSFRLVTLETSTTVTRRLQDAAQTQENAHAAAAAKLARAAQRWILAPDGIERPAGQSHWYLEWPMVRLPTEIWEAWNPSMNHVPAATTFGGYVYARFEKFDMKKPAHELALLLVCQVGKFRWMPVMEDSAVRRLSDIARHANTSYGQPGHQAFIDELTQIPLIRPTERLRTMWDPFTLVCLLVAILRHWHPEEFEHNKTDGHPEKKLASHISTRLKDRGITLQLLCRIGVINSTNHGSLFRQDTKPRLGHSYQVPSEAQIAARLRTAKATYSAGPKEQLWTELGYDANEIARYLEAEAAAERMEEEAQLRLDAEHQIMLAESDTEEDREWEGESSSEGTLGWEQSDGDFEETESWTQESSRGSSFGADD